MANITASEARQTKQVACGPFSYIRKDTRRTYIPGRPGYIHHWHWDAFMALQAALGEGR